MSDPNSPPADQEREQIASFRNELDAIYQKCAADIGRIAIAWNALHEQMGDLFSIITTPHTPNVGLAIWHAVKSDRNLRDMLVAAAEARFESGSRFPRDLKAGLDKMNSLENKRNDFVHAPYSFYLNEDFHLQYGPSHWQGNKRAVALAAKDDLAEEIKYCLAHLDEMHRFIERITPCVGAPDDSPSWPEIPKQRRTQSDTKQSRRNSRRQPERPPRSSPE